VGGAEEGSGLELRVRWSAKEVIVIFEAKITKVKRSKKFEAKISEKREVKFYSEIVKHM
jgi:hypothetical protein